MKDLINTVQQGLEKDLSIAKKMILSDENDYIINLNNLKELFVVDKWTHTLKMLKKIRRKIF